MQELHVANPEKRIVDYDITALFNMAYIAVATIDKSVARFETTGIFHFNRNKIQSHR